MDGTSQLIMSSNNQGEIQIYVADPDKGNVVHYKG